MSLNWPIHSVASNKQFWTDYFWQTSVPYGEERYRALVNYEEPLSQETKDSLRRLKIFREKQSYCRLDVPLGDHAIRLQFDQEIGEVNLALVKGARKSWQLGWDDQAHWHPHALRAEELDVLCRCVAKLDVSLPHPGVPLLLFARFSIITDSDDSGAALARQCEAWRSLGLFTEEEIGEFVKFRDFRETGTIWEQNERGWWMLRQVEERPEIGLYTLRCQENSEFPFEQLEEAMANARRIAE